MKTSDKLKLALLMSKAELTADEKRILAKLKARAAKAKLDVDQIAKDFAPDAEEGGGEDEDEDDEEEDEEEDEDEDEGSKSLSEAELTNLITKAVKAASDGTEVDQAALIAEIKKSAKGGLTADQVDKIVKKHIGGTGIDKEALLKDIEKMVSEGGTAYEKALTKALSKFAASIKQPSANEFSNDFERDFPFEHRERNLTVAEKQLANVCLASLPEEKHAEMSYVPKGMNDGISEDQLKHAARRGQQHAKAARHAVLYGGKALTTSGVGSGAELIPTDLSSDLMARMYLESQIAAELMASEIDMPTNPFEFPLVTTRTNFYVGAEAPENDPTASEPGTGKIILTAQKLIGMSEFSYEANEDAIFAMLPLLQEQLGTGAADAFEGALINGDTTGTHMDSDIHAVTGHHAKLFKGLRKYALAGNLKKDLSSGGINATNIAAMRKEMHRWGIRPRDLMLVVGAQGYNDLVTLDETLTFDKVGSQSAARILTGEASSIFGIRIVVSSQIREDLNESGVYDGVTDTKGSILLVHRPSFMVGVKRGMTIEVDVNKKRQMNAVIASFRRAFQPKETPSAAIPTVMLGYNYDAA